MAFAALIAAYQEAEEGEAGLRALLPMAGRSLLEHQVRRAVAAGASHAVILVERVPAALSAALDRLRRDGIAVKLARDPIDAADRFHPEEHVLLIADGLVAAPDCFEAMAVRTAPALLVLADTPENEDFERVDANHRWAGLALTTVDTVAATAAMLGDWDLQSTLMRRVVQAGADFLPVDGEAGVVVDASDAVLLAERSDKSRDAGRTMLRRNSVQSDSWPDRFLYAPVVTRIAPMLLDRGIEAIWLRIAALVLAFAGAAAFWWGWLWTGLALVLIAGPVDAIAGRIDLAQLRNHEGGWEIRFLKGLLQGLAILAIGWLAMTTTGEIVYLALAATAVLLLVLARRGVQHLRKLTGSDNRYLPWLADGNAAIWLILPFAVTGYWFHWPIAVAIYAYITLFLQQNMLKEAVRQRG
ncbi:hypothetical protein HFP57_04540 [Parasphingopyxis algicola]|uniref:hypothetical protein n=1 Tax=Parasphingopyxis algicola TaxID=2026624 RepID=UPI0015A46FF3|nr:hypothetical protein [Parasphingopyxis algicola]QLC24367.1 hypothetical protein HFP57_04540 [Parasphingopyxis algicola]